jgi:putative DNA primase/helicase
LGNGQRLIDLHGDKIRFDTGRKLWYVYDGKLWVENAWADVMELAKDVARKMRLEANKLDDPSAYKALANHAAKTEDVRKYEAMAKAASTDKQIRVTVSAFDSHPHLLNAATGIIDLRTGKLLPHDPALMLSHCLSVSFDPFATDARFEKFLNRILMGIEI